MANDNCLKGLRCPKCKNEYMLRIATTCWAEVMDGGIEDSFEHEWVDNSACVCPTCQWVGTIKDFTIKKKRLPGKKEKP